MHYLSRFQGLGRTLVTLTQFWTLDAISTIYVPLCIQWPWLIIYFAAFFLVVSVAWTNMVTAIMVDNTLSEQATAGPRGCLEGGCSYSRLASSKSEVLGFGNCYK